MTEGAHVPNVAQTTADRGVYTFKDVVFVYLPETSNVQFAIEAGFIEQEYVRAAIKNSTFKANSARSNANALRNAL